MDTEGISLLERNIKKLSKQYGITEVSAIEYMNAVKDGSIQLKDGQTMLQGYEAYLQSTGKATNLANASTKALSVSMKVLSTVGWMAAITAVTWAIGKVVEGIDDYIHRLDNAKEALNETQSNMSSLQSEIDEVTAKIKDLDSLDSPSIVEKDDLEQLRLQNEELKIRQQYLEAQEQRDKERVSDLTKQKYGQKYAGKEADRDSVDSYKQQLYAPKNTQPQSTYLNGTASTQVNPYAAGQQDRLAQESNSLASLIAQYEYYEDKKTAAVQAEDAEAIDNYNEKLGNLTVKLSSNRAELQGFYDDLLKVGDTGKMSTDIKNQMDIIDSTILSKSQRFENFLSGNITGDQKQQLVDLANQGELTSDVLSKNFSNIDNYLKNNGLTIDDLILKMGLLEDEISSVVNADIKPKSLQEIIASLDTMSDKFASIDKLYASFKDGESGGFSNDDLSAVIDAFKDVEGINLDGFLDTLTNTGATAEQVQEAFNDLTSEYINGTGILDSVNESNANYVSTKLQEIGVTNSVALVEAQLTVSRNEAALASAVVTNATYGELAALRDEIATTDEAKFAINQYYLEKITANGITLSTSGDIANIMSLVQACGGGIAALKALADARQGLFNSFNATLSTTDWKASSPIGQDVALKNAEIELANYNKKQKQLTEDAEKEINAVLSKKFSSSGGNYGGNASNSGGGSKSGGGGGKGSSGSGSSAEKEIDWIDRKLKLLEDKRSQLESKSSSSFLSYLGLDENSIATAKDIIGKLSDSIGISNEEFDLLSAMSKKAGMSMTDFYGAVQNGDLESRKGHLASLLKTDTALLEEYSSAAESYKQAYEKSLEGLSDEIRNKVENGGDDVSIYTGGEGEKVQAAIDARDKYLDSIQKEADQKEQLVETTKQYYENEIAHLDAQSDRLISQNDLINAQIDYLTTSGQVVNSSTYEATIANLRQQEQVINEKLKKRKLELQAFLDSPGAKEGSKEYYDLQDSIEDCEASLVDLNTQQEEFNNKLIQLPIDNMDIVIGMYQDMNTAMTNWADEAEASGKKVGSEYYAELIKNGMTIIDQHKEQAELIRDVMDAEYDVGSENWNTLYNRLQSINAEMSSMVQNLHKWNEALLQMPIDSVSDLSSSLQKALDAMSTLQGDYDTVISAVTGAIKEQIDALNDEKDLINEQKNAQLEVLQERLELLQQQNEALNLQTSLEQALYNLQNANTQRTETVIRNGEVVYESKANNIKNAEEEVQNALAALEEYKLSQEIKDLEKELDAINDKYEDQIKQLEKVSDKWSEIASKIEQVKNESIADGYLGNGWEDKVLNGNDDAIFKSFEDSYKVLADNMSKYEEQIQSTENIHKLLQDYIQSYKEGNITYEQASKGISDLLSQMNQKMSAMDNLDNVLGFLGTANDSESSIEGVLDGIQSSLTETADELLKSFQTYNENSGLISEYTTSWQQLTTNVEDIRDLIEDVRDNLEDVISDLSFKNDDDDEKEDRPSSSVVVTPGSPGGSYVTGGGDYVNSGPGARIAIEKKHDGIESGLIGEADRKRAELLKLVSSAPLKRDETYLKALKGEAIFTEEQQRNLLNNFKASGYGYAMVQPYRPELVNVKSMNQPIDNRIYVDNVNLPDVTKADEFANAMKHLGSDLRQIKSRPSYLNNCK